MLVDYRNVNSVDFDHQKQNKTPLDTDEKRMSTNVPVEDSEEKAVEEENNLNKLIMMIYSLDNEFHVEFHMELMNVIVTLKFIELSLSITQDDFLKLIGEIDIENNENRQSNNYSSNQCNNVIMTRVIIIIIIIIT